MSSVSVGHPNYTKTLRGVDNFLGQLHFDSMVLWNGPNCYFLVFHSDSSVSFQELSSDSFPHIFDVRKQILLRELIVSFSLLFCRFSTASRPRTQKMVLKVSVTFPHFGTEPIVAVKIPVKFFPFCLFFLAELTYPRLRVLLHFDTQEFLNVLSMVSKPVLP